MSADKQIYRVVIDASIEDVWKTLTQEGEVLPFFFGSVLHTTRLAPGAPIRMRTKDGKYTAVVGEVLEIDPPRRYAHTMKFTTMDDPVCKVTYELEQLPHGVQFTLITEDVPPGTKTEKYMSMGGDFIVQTIKSCLERGKPPFKSKLILALGRLTAPLTPKRCRSENWPFDKRIA